MWDTSVKVAGGVRRLALGVWVGASVFFSAVVAPTLFRVLQNAPEGLRPAAPRALAGDVVVPCLQALAWLGLVCGLLALVALRLEKPQRHVLGSAAAVGVGLVCTLVSLGWLTPRMLALQGQMGGPVDLLAPDHPVRVAFGGLHGVSAALHLGMMVGAAWALVMEPRIRSAPGHSTARAAS